MGSGGHGLLIHPSTPSREPSKFCFTTNLKNPPGSYKSIRTDSSDIFISRYSFGLSKIWGPKLILICYIFMFLRLLYCTVHIKFYFQLEKGSITQMQPLAHPIGHKSSLYCHAQHFLDASPTNCKTPLKMLFSQIYFAIALSINIIFHICPYHILRTLSNPSSFM